ncbi:hypothetical protein [Candidatus Laterigemmans baculatus]|uniref:hypothetical protein n=1 Tax=Candidatus Laterigemmans baculatus TaxID=2770505 RepID=UPI0013DAD74F|nr:hypothetical protein [Candidatus Laterigemmans baculatus]
MTGEFRTLMAAAALVAVWSAMPGAAPAFSASPASSAATAADFPRPVAAPRETSLRIFAEGKTLEETLAGIRERTGLRVWRDRRVDPALPLLSENYGPTAGAVLDQLAAEHQLEVAVADEVVLLGPAPAPELAATEMMAAWDSLVASGREDRPDDTLTQTRAVRWPMLTTPSEALQTVAEQWDLRIDSVSLPHDLWPAVDLGEVRVTTALGLIGVGFDLSLELDPVTRRVTAEPLGPQTRVAREYPGQTLPPQLRSRLTSPAVGGQLRKQGDRWLLSGPAKAHAMLESLLVSTGTGSQPPDSARAREMRAAASHSGGDPQNREVDGLKRYSLRLVNKPADAFLESLCRSVGWQLEIAPEAAAPLTQRIDLEVEQATLDELIERAVGPLGLRAERDGERLRIVGERR